MAGFYQTFTLIRNTEIDWTSLLNQLRSLDVTAGFVRVSMTEYKLKKNSIWTGPQISAAQNVLDTAPIASAQLTAQSIIDSMPIFEKAIILTIIDQLNILRAFHSLATVTPAQAVTAVRNKAGQL